MADAVEEHRKALEREYGTYTALGPITIGGALAFATGDPVPVSHVENGLVDAEQVAKSTTKAAAKAKNEGNV